MKQNQQTVTATVKQRIKRSKARMQQAGIAMSAWMMTAMAQAALPTVAAPTRGTTPGNFLKLIQDYAYDFAIFIGLAIAALALFVVAKNVITTYNDVPNGKATMGGVAVQAGVGVLLIVIIVFLVTEASKVL